MRAIKFRAWDTKSKHMSHEQVNPFDGDYLIEFEHINLDRSSKDLIWMQYTGLKDKNGKEVYEGDIVDIVKILTTIPPQPFDKRGLITYTAPEFHASGHSLQGYEYEVIGNVFENPELFY